jgi:quercetin dioxygenase-like cupin family protein
MSTTEQIKSLVRKLRDFRVGYSSNGERHIVSVGQKWERFGDSDLEAIWVPTPGFQATAMLFRAPAGSAIDLHRHEPVESLIVVGEVELQIDDDTHRMSGGDAVKVESMQPHAAKFLTDSLISLVWNPGFPSDPNDPTRVLWGASPDDVEKYASTLTQLRR